MRKVPVSEANHVARLFNESFLVMMAKVANSGESPTWTKKTLLTAARKLKAIASKNVSVNPSPGAGARGL